MLIQDQDRGGQRATGSYLRILSRLDKQQTRFAGWSKSRLDRHQDHFACAKGRFGTKNRTFARPDATIIPQGQITEE